MCCASSSLLLYHQFSSAPRWPAFLPTLFYFKPTVLPFSCLSPISLCFSPVFPVIYGRGRHSCSVRTQRCAATSSSRVTLQACTRAASVVPCASLPPPTAFKPLSSSPAEPFHVHRQLFALLLPPQIPIQFLLEFLLFLPTAGSHSLAAASLLTVSGCAGEELAVLSPA